MLTVQRGTIKVRPRHPDTREILTDREPVEFPVGPDLIDEVRSRYNFNEMHESNAVRRYAASVGLDLRDVIAEYLEGQDLGRVRVERFLTNTGLRPLFSPVVEDGIRLGLGRIAPVWQNLIARTVQVDQLSYEYYEFSSGVPAVAGQVAPGSQAFGLRQIGQGAPIPTARVTVSGKAYTLYKQGRGIEWTDEAKLAPIDLAAMWFQQVGIQLGWDYHNQIVDILLNGYFADNSDDAPVLTTGSAGADPIKLADLLNAVGTMQTVYGYSPTVMLMSLSRSIAVQTMENTAGNSVFPNGVEALGLPPIQLSSQVPNDKIIFVDTGFAVMRLVNKEFGTEFDRNVQTQVEGSYGTSIEVTVPLFAQARLILDGP